ncbi:hypothetical protein [Nocardia wallacei]|uniref:hypothetical protein n=1 Tax=Nocardia wallacei TaxID=480035 RepID=UPI0024589CA6|nr:hypothetical protein [Nocardia wallacei]
MKAGFVTETAVVVYCHSCGETFGACSDCWHPLLFSTAEEATRFLSDLNVCQGWQTDGDQVLCDVCAVIAECEATEGHDWPTTIPACTRCGIHHRETSE